MLLPDGSTGLSAYFGNTKATVPYTPTVGALSGASASIFAHGKLHDLRSDLEHLPTITITGTALVTVPVVDGFSERGYSRVRFGGIAHKAACWWH